MESRKRRRRGPAASRVAPTTVAPAGALANIAELIEDGGQITVGALHPIPCVAIANDDHDALAMLRRRPGETLQHLLDRLDTAIELAWTTHQLTDEINLPSRPIKRR